MERGEPEHDKVIHIQGKPSLRLPAGVFEAAPLVVNFAWAHDVQQGDGDVWVFVLTDEPTTEEIGSGGAEKVAKLGLRLRVGRFLDFAGWVAERAAMLRGQE